MIPLRGRRGSRLLLASLFAMSLSLPALPSAAQGEYTCQGTAIVDDGLSSAAMGLTRGEIDALTRTLDRQETAIAEFLARDRVSAAGQ